MNHNEVNIAGVGIFQGDIDADIVKCFGVGKTLGTVKCRQMMVKGVFSTTKRVYAQSVDVKGVLKCASELSAERFVVMGSVVSQSLLNGGEIDIQFERLSKAREVGGERISIRPGDFFHKERLGKPGKQFMGLIPNGVFKAEVIEGNDIYLEIVQAGTVRGQIVVIGPNCRVAYLEYSNKAKVHESSNVLEIKGQKVRNI